MSAETEIVAALKASPAVTGIVGQRVRVDRGEEGEPLPLVAISREATEPFDDISGNRLAALVTLDVYCISEKSRAQADALAVAVEDAIRAVPSQVVRGRRAEYDPENGLMTTVLSVDWFEINT